MSITLGTIAIMGGGCYGRFYLGQLQQARRRGAIEFARVVVVDHDPQCQTASLLDEFAELRLFDWSAFLDDWLTPDRRDDDMIVPTPLMPHLMAHWIERRARNEWPDRNVELIPVEQPLGTPYDRLHTDKVRYVSFADWLCPTHCVEPLLCPAIKAPRTWEMSQAIDAWDLQRTHDRPTAGPALMQCRHVAYGVGMYRARDPIEAFDRLKRAVADDGAELPIGSISSCHGALALLEVGPRRRAYIPA